MALLAFSSSPRLGNLLSKGEDECDNAWSPPIEEAMGPICVCCMDENPHRPSPLSHMAENAYVAVERTKSALNILTILQVFQTRLLKSMDEDGPDPESLCKISISIQKFLLKVKDHDVLI